jgi:type II secretory pathway predicted ATPase ExeA
VYEDHFGLKDRPFRETVNPAAYVALPSRDSALRRLRYGLEHGDGPALLFGPPGSGKTLIAQRLAADVGTAVIHLTFPSLPPQELLTLIAEELGGPLPGPPGMASMLRRVRDLLAAAASTGQRPLLIVDEAHLVEDPSGFETLRLLLNFATGGTPDLSLLLVGAADLALQLPPSLADRLTARCLLGPLSEAETAGYIDGRLSFAGSASNLFTAEALTALHRFADGLPRRLNHLADLSLLIAYAESRPQADARTVSIAAREFQYDHLAA